MGRRGTTARHTVAMQIILDITQDAAGRLSGAVRAVGMPERTFSGAMELLASIEELCGGVGARQQDQ